MKRPEEAYIHIGDSRRRCATFKLQEVIELPDELVHGYLLGCTVQDNHPSDYPDLHFTGNPGTFKHDAKAWLERFVTAVQARTPLTRENILAWAKGQVAKYPTSAGAPHQLSVGQKAEETPNTVARQLAMVLQIAAARSYEDYGASDAREDLITTAWEGRKGYKDYTEDEALDEICSDLVDPDNSPYEFDDLEDFLELFELTETESEEE